MKNPLGDNIAYYVDNHATLPDFGTWEDAALWTYSRIHYDKVVFGSGITTLANMRFILFLN